MCTRFLDTVFIHCIEEVKSGYYPSFHSKSPGFLISIHCSLLLEFKLVAEVTHYSSALHEYKVHNLSLSSDSRQDLQLDPKSIPSVHVEPRHSYQFRLSAHHTIL